MSQAGVISFNIGAFISTLFLLEFGADKFIDHAASLAAEIGVSQVIIGLLTAGAEWEEVSSTMSGNNYRINRLSLNLASSCHC